MSRSNLAFAKEEIISPEEYLEFEREAFEKHEFINGEIVAMAGASENHNVIASNLYGEIFVQLKNTKCRGFASDMRVKAAKAKKSNYFYPDLVITCGERKFDGEKKDVLLNPKVVVEILSKSTKLRDRNEKLESYMALESLDDYVLVEQDTMRIEHYSRIDKENWKSRLLTSDAAELILDSIKCSVSLADIYNEVKFESVSKKRKKNSKAN
jgi:Uma2 family endonuclease